MQDNLRTAKFHSLRQREFGSRIRNGRARLFYLHELALNHSTGDRKMRASQKYFRCQNCRLGCKIRKRSTFLFLNQLWKSATNDAGSAPGLSAKLCKAEAEAFRLRDQVLVKIASMNSSIGGKKRGARTQENVTEAKMARPFMSGPFSALRYVACRAE